MLGYTVQFLVCYRNQWVMDRTVAELKGQTWSIHKQWYYYPTLGPMIAFIRQLDADSSSSLSPSQSLPHTSLVHSTSNIPCLLDSYRVNILPTGLPLWQRDWTGPIMLIVLFLVSHFNFLFVPCGGLSWLTVSFLLHVKHTLSYCIVSYRNNNIIIKHFH